jgi:hypothetical protein
MVRSGWRRGSLRWGFRGCQLDVHGFVTPEAMDQWDKKAVQSRILTCEQPSCTGRIFA